MLTSHRRENFGKPLENICFAIKELVAKQQLFTLASILGSEEKALDQSVIDELSPSEMSTIEEVMKSQVMQKCGLVKPQEKTIHEESERN